MINQFYKEYLELKRFRRVRNDFHRTIKQWGMELEYKQPVNVGYCWRMEYKGITVEGNSETDCFQLMKKEVHNKMEILNDRGEFSYD